MMHTMREWFRRSPWLASVTLAHLALFVVLALLSVGDSVQVMGIRRWIKPMKFCLSIALYLGALAWFAPVVGTPASRRIPYALASGTMVVEIIAIVVQAARGTTSHFNEATWFDARLFNLMGVAIMLNTIAMLWIARLAFSGWRAVPTGYRLGIVLGLVLALGSSAIGGLMISSHAHTVGLSDGGAGLPFVNWSTRGGDLRVSHFAGLHAMQGLPVIGHYLGGRAVVITAFAWLVLTAVTLAQALAGRPLLG